MVISTLFYTLADHFLIPPLTPAVPQIPEDRGGFMISVCFLCPKAIVQQKIADVHIARGNLMIWWHDYFLFNTAEDCYPA